MTVRVDGYKLYVAVDSNQIEHPIAGISHSDVMVRAKTRGIEPIKIHWHPMYRQYASGDWLDRIDCGKKIEALIWEDVANFD